jgi:uncharacterized protein (DUF433 family)
MAELADARGSGPRSRKGVEVQVLLSAPSVLSAASQRAELESAIWTDPQRMSGTPCFRNTRVPLQSLIDFLEGGETVDEFLRLYPAVSRDQIITVLNSLS